MISCWRCFKYRYSGNIDKKISGVKKFDKFAKLKRKEINAKYLKLFVDLFQDLLLDYQNNQKMADAYARIWEIDFDKIVAKCRSDLFPGEDLDMLLMIDG